MERKNPKSTLKKEMETQKMERQKLTTGTEKNDSVSISSKFEENIQGSERKRKKKEKKTKGERKSKEKIRSRIQLCVSSIHIPNSNV